MFNLNSYIERIGYSGKLIPDLDCLKAIHRCHLMAIPFEALNIHFKIPIPLGIDKIYDKVVENNRGGYCYELNSLFNKLLTEIGFKTKIISASLWKEGVYGPLYNHLAIVVELDEMYLVDVGFGDLFIEPIQITSNIIQEDRTKLYKIESIGNEFLLKESFKEQQEFIPKYKFDLITRSVEEFSAENEWKQKAPESHFVKNTICTLPTKNGRKTIFNNIFKNRIGDQLIERKISNDLDLLLIIKEEFNMEMNEL